MADAAAVTSDGAVGAFPELQPHLDALLDRLAANGPSRDAAPLLDIGAGDGSTLSALVAGAGLSGAAVDLRQPDIWRGPPGFPLVLSDGARLPFAGGAFASSIVADGYEWFAGPAAVIAEQRRVTRGACLLVQTDWTSLWLDSGDPETAREFTRLFAGREARGLLRRIRRTLEDASVGPVSEQRQTVRGASLRPGTFAREMLRGLRRELVLDLAVVRARRFDEWRKELEQRDREGRFSFSLQRQVFAFAGLG